MKLVHLSSETGCMCGRLQAVGLVDWNWAGHHPTYFSYFQLALEELGLDVLAVCPNPIEAEATANETRQAAGANGSDRGRTTFATLRAASRRFHGLRPARIGAIDWTIRHFRGIEQQAQECAAKVGRKADAIFYACMYDRDFQWVHTVQPFLHVPWVGLYLHATSYRTPVRLPPGTNRLPQPERMFGGRLCKAVGILDEGIVKQVSDSIGKPVVVFPDLTDERQPASPAAVLLASRLKHFADGRPIVGLVGYLQPSKGLLPLLLASQDPRLSKVCFAFAGEVPWPLFSSQECRTISDVLSNRPNTWNHLMRIPDEEQLNSLLAACDILYAAYIDFPHSSGIVTKAALLKRPIIVSDGYLMAERVRHFKLGEVVPQSNVDALVAAILKITRNPSTWIAENQPQWPDFMREHSFERLKDSFRELLACV
jgi:glycosyltransferase involved in cell wall biosynthesis